MTQRVFYIVWSVVGVLCIALLGIGVFVGIRIVAITYRLEELITQLQQSGILEGILRSL